jgi:hypothetical protein
MVGVTAGQCGVKRRQSYGGSDGGTMGCRKKVRAGHPLTWLGDKKKER